MRVLCTAGHVDHGKSSLVRALTGMEPDRLEEERRRGLTIELGYAWATLAGEGPAAGRTVAFVDLPGHERFIATMLAGAGPVALALFVVAADEGWMPQSQEHLEILDLLGVGHAVIALTKADRVGPETLAARREELSGRLAGGPLASAEIVTTSTGARGDHAPGGDGLDPLRAALLRLLAAAPAPADRGRPRLWVDRAFAIRGAGTVVTGTLTGGSVAPGDQVTIRPSGRTARVRSVQALGEPAERALPGSRAALNLAGIRPSAARDGGAGDGHVGRGDAVTAGVWHVTARFDARLRVLEGRQVRRRGAWTVHVGSAEVPARLYPLAGEHLGPDGACSVELAHPLPLQAGDRAVVRDAGRGATVAGGVVCDPAPGPRPRGSRARAHRTAGITAVADALASHGPGSPEVVAAWLALHRAAPAGAAAAACAAPPTTQGAGSRRVVAGWWVHPPALRQWREAVVAALAAAHAAAPAVPSAPVAVAADALTTAGCPGSLVQPVLDELVADGSVRRVRDPRRGVGLALAGHAPRLDPAQDAAAARLLGALGREPFRPPDLAGAARAAGVAPPLLAALEAAGRLVRVAPDLAFHPDAVDAAVARVRTAGRPLTLSEIRQLLGSTRKYVLPLMEELDRRGLTRRRGDLREVP